MAIALLKIGQRYINKVTVIYTPGEITSSWSSYYTAEELFVFLLHRNTQYS